MMEEMDRRFKRNHTERTELFTATKKYFKSNSPTKRTNVKTYKIMIRTIIMSAAEARTLTQKDVSSLTIFERKVIRTVLGTIKTSANEYRNRMN